MSSNRVSVCEIVSDRSTKSKKVDKIKTKNIVSFLTGFCFMSDRHLIKHSVISITMVTFRSSTDERPLSSSSPVASDVVLGAQGGPDLCHALP